MPDDTDLGGVDLDLTDPGDDDDNPQGEDAMPFPEHTESGNLQLAMSTLVQGFSAGAQRRSDRADQLAGDSAAMWSIAMTTPTVNAGLGFRTANESGAGRTRVEANTPVGPQTQGG